MMKKMLLLLLMLLALAMPASADVEIPRDTTAIGPQAFLDCSTLAGTLVIPDGVTEIGEEAFMGCSGLTGLVLPDSVATIGDRAFAGCTQLTGIVVPDGVSIGEDAFADTQVRIMESTAAGDFAYELQADGTAVITGYLGETADGVVVLPAAIGDCPVTALGEGVFKQLAVTEVYLPDSLLTIGDSAFAHCSRMTAVYGGGSVTHYGEFAFYYCEELSRMYINEDALAMGEYAFAYCAKLNATLSMSADAAFNHLSFHDSGIVALGFEIRDGEVALKYRFGGTPREHLIVPEAYKGYPVTVVACADYPYGHDGPAYHLTLPSTVRCIEDYGMRDCDALRKVDFAGPSALTEIGVGSFSGLYNLEEVVLPPSLKVIGNDAFKYDEKLVSLTLPDGLEKLGESAFWFTKIPSIDIPSAWTEIPPYAFYGMALTEFTIPERITKVGRAAFAATTLTTLVIPETVQEVGGYTFAGCKQITTAVLPEHLTEIPDCAFMNCTSLTSVDLPDGVTWIGLAAFAGCEKLEYVELPPNLTHIIACVFDDCGVRTRAVERVVAECITDGMTDFEKALALHDWLINHADYSSYRTFFGAEGVLVYGEGVCQSYAGAYGMLLDAVGISHMPVASQQMDHIWNLIQLDGEWYHVDVTWDDPVGGEEQHLYFGLTDELMAADHTWDNADSLPAATGTRYQYGVDGGK